ncbi:hypothetical protein C2R62_03135 [Helicobacter pylori]|uniref:ATPase, T2SS/T4P/T4SS family n=2 Tax=Helicobacter pylori TaxID=210 RepID=UPI000D358E37|nr:ATPase, T2SS/T4P/T4SS family [Helicobacter pylori]PUD79766.1 hypothetical protein C2R62_03135 [Helicobacter pylori]
MYKNCVFIIESPNKIAKIKELTGSSFGFATGGHFVELVNIEVSKEFNPIFEIKKSTDKKKDKSTHINYMINQCKDNVVYIATDPDREGYGIGYKFYEKIKNIAKTIYRTEFHEITKSGVEKGLNNAVLFSQSNLNLYYSWLGRIASDQFVGFTLTPYLRKNIKNFEVSAGRVQTPVLSILVELDRKIQAFEQKNIDEKLSYSIEAIIDVLGSQISITLVEENKRKVFETKELAQNFLNDLKNNLNPLAFLDAVEQKDKEKSPPKPFTTSNLLKDGVRILEMGVKQIQEHAQKLFEAGLITYIRTDSEALSKEYLQEHKAFFENIYPSVYEYREYRAGKNSQAEAHEAIRITHPHRYEDLKKVCEKHNIRVPSNFKFEINAFKLSEKCLAKNITYDFLLNLVSAGKNILISGGTASGKTSFVNSLIENIPKNERVVTIEDSPELKISNEDQVNILVDKSGSGFFTYEDGLNAAMRMSPDRLLLGEIDTHNTALFLRLANTGHSGMISTLHANSVADAFIAICQNINLNKGGKPTPKETLLDYFCTGMDYVIQIKKKGSDRIIDDVLNVKSEFKKELVL